MDKNKFPLEMKFIEKCVGTRNRHHKIFLCDEGLIDYLSNFKTISKNPVKFIENLEFFENYKSEKGRDSPYLFGELGNPIFARLDDPNFYIVNLKKIKDTKDKKDLIENVKMWYYYGADRFDTTAYLAMLEKDYRLESFNNGLKLWQIVVEMDNSWNLETILEEL